MSNMHNPAHPGEVLREYLPEGVSIGEVAKRLGVGVEHGPQVGRQVHDQRLEQPLRLDGTPARALLQPLEAHPLVGGVLVHEQEVLPVARHDVDEPVLAQHQRRGRGARCRSDT